MMALFKRKKSINQEAATPVAKLFMKTGWPGTSSTKRASRSVFAIDRFARQKHRELERFSGLAVSGFSVIRV